MDGMDHCNDFEPYIFNFHKMSRKSLSANYKMCTSVISIYGTICLPVGLERTTVADVSAHRGREDKSACCLRRMWVMTRARFGSRCVRLLLGSTCNVMECMSVPQGRHRDREVSVDGPF